MCGVLNAPIAAGAESLEAAQADKMRHIAEKLLIEPGIRVLDIGSGWRGLALWIAGACGGSLPCAVYGTNNLYGGVS